GFNVNVPFPLSCGDADYAEAFERIVEPIGRQFDPDFVLISAGFDCHAGDPLSQIRVTTDGFGAMTRSLLRIASGGAGGRCAAVLEGGYDLEALAESAGRVLDELGGGMIDTPVDIRHTESTAVAAAVSIQRQFWKVS
ncbi:MAG: histone deacetylase, partial [bacterium]